MITSRRFSAGAAWLHRGKVRPFMIETNATKSEKVVIQFGTKTIKGYLEPSAWNTIEELLSSAPLSSPETFRVRRFESDVVEEISIKDVKAVFYVNCFDGDSDHNQLNFHTRAPIVHGIWMRFQFLDGEVMEGIVYNSIRYLVDPGFFVLPTDPGSNNKLVYVMKSWLVDHRVLGMRKL
jgi:hypothetical protein